MSNITEKDFTHLTISINKALNGIEAPLKAKHVRSAIIITHKTKETKSFWMVISRQPLMENRFTAWKFCHMLHKVLREGHESTLKHSRNHKTMILELGKLWGHLNDGVGVCIQAYSKLLVTKISFHEKNAIFPGSLKIEFSDLVRYANKDMNIFFQLCVEIFDYLDDIIALQKQIFSSITTFRMSSMTQQGQCRLAPLIPLIQDSNPLYDTCVRLMFRLHDELPNDILSGHRQRFRDIFIKLKSFYDNVRPLQYFADLLQVPHLPEQAPNFSSKVDFGSYIAPVVYVQPEPEVIVDDIVDTSVSTTNSAPIPSNIETELHNNIKFLENRLTEKDAIIQSLKLELANSKRTTECLQKNFNAERTQLGEANASLSNELASTKEQYVNMRIKKDELEMKLSNTPTLIQKATEEEERAKASVEKFAKLKNVYTELRDDHINLLRQHSDTTKQLNQERQKNSELLIQTQNFPSRFAVIEERIKSYSSKFQEIESQLVECKKVQSDLVSTLRNQQFQRGQLEQQSKVNAQDLLESKRNLSDKISELEKYSTQLKDISTQLQQAELKIVELNKENEQCKTTYENKLKQKNSVIDELSKKHEESMERLTKACDAEKQTVIIVENQLKEKVEQIHNLTKERSNIEAIRDEIQERCTKSEQTLAETFKQNEKLAEIRRHDLWSIIKTVLKCFNEVDLYLFEETQHEQLIEYVPEIINKLLPYVDSINVNILDCPEQSDSFIKSLAYINFVYLKLYDQCESFYTNTSDFPSGQAVIDQAKTINVTLHELLQTLHTFVENTNPIDTETSSTNLIESSTNELKTKLKQLKFIIEEFISTTKPTFDLDILVQNELREMDSAIEEAASKILELLSSARREHSGIKLEVNEKILDACTTLMECIRILIQKSRSLQSEIVALGKGNATVKDFYKRNSQWSEGLISAAKSVARGAHMLVEAANKAVTNETPNNFELIVAAQEIAACTAQLVISSKVKARSDSQKLLELTKASRDVSKSTGAVVATVKSCNENLEEVQDMEISQLNSSQIKAMEMEMHIRVLELEQALDKQQKQLTSFRRKHYHNTDY